MTLPTIILDDRVYLCTHDRRRVFGPNMTEGEARANEPHVVRHMMGLNPAVPQTPAKKSDDLYERAADMRRTRFHGGRGRR